MTDHTIWDDNPHSNAFRRQIKIHSLSKAPRLCVHYNQKQGVLEAILKGPAKVYDTEILTVSDLTAMEPHFPQTFPDWCRALLEDLGQDMLQVICVATLDTGSQWKALYIAEKIQELSREITGWEDQA